MLKPGEMFKTELGIALVVKADEEHSHLFHIVIGKNKDYVFNSKTGEIKDYIMTILDCIFEDFIVNDSKIEEISSIIEE